MNMNNENQELLNQGIRLDKLAINIPGVIYQFQLTPDGAMSFPYASQGMLDIFEVSPEAAKNDASEVFSRIHPEDLPMLIETIEKSRVERSVWELEFRVILPSKGLR